MSTRWLLSAIMGFELLVFCCIELTPLTLTRLPIGRCRSTCQRQRRPSVRGRHAKSIRCTKSRSTRRARLVYMPKVCAMVCPAWLSSPLARIILSLMTPALRKWRSCSAATVQQRCLSATCRTSIAITVRSLLHAHALQGRDGMTESSQDMAVRQSQCSTRKRRLQRRLCSDYSVLSAKQSTCMPSRSVSSVLGPILIDYYHSHLIQR